MLHGEQQRSDGVIEKCRNEKFNISALPHSNTPIMAVKRIRTRVRPAYGFALYEVLLGVAIFAVGVIALGRAVENCINASTISAEENVVRTDPVRSNGASSSCVSCSRS